jgi:hypothetical protein
MQPSKPRSTAQVEQIEDLSQDMASDHADRVKGGIIIIGGVGDTEVVSPRDPASGLATGKRQHKPF